MCKSQTTLSFRLSFPADGVYGAVCRPALRWTLTLYHMRSLVVSIRLNKLTPIWHAFRMLSEACPAHPLPPPVSPPAHHWSSSRFVTAKFLCTSARSSCLRVGSYAQARALASPKFNIPNPTFQIHHLIVLSFIPIPKSQIQNPSYVGVPAKASTEQRCLDLLSYLWFDDVMV